MTPETKHPTVKRRWLNALLVFSYFLMGFWTLAVVAGGTGLEPAPVSDIGEWVSEKPTWQAGSIAQFRLLRKADNVPTSCMRIDSLYSLDSKQSYPATLTYIEVTHKGTHRTTSSYRIPDWVKPSSYIVTGMLMPYGERSIAVAPYRSKPFRVVSP